MDVFKDTKYDKKLQRVLVAATAKESTRYAMMGIKAEADKIVTTDGRQLIVVKSDHLLLPGDKKQVIKRRITEYDVDGTFPAWRSILEDCQDKEEKGHKTHPEDTFGLAAMKYIAKHSLVVDMVRFHRTFEAIDALDVVRHDGVVFSHVDQGKHCTGVFHAHIETKSFTLDYVTVTVTR